MRATIILAKPITNIEADFDENSIKAAGYHISRWIPCSERLPEYGQLVLTYNLKDDDYDLNHIIDEEDGEWFIHGVDAWMPLPEPYKGGDTNDVS